MEAIQGCPGILPPAPGGKSGTVLDIGLGSNQSPSIKCWRRDGLEIWTCTLHSTRTDV